MQELTFNTESQLTRWLGHIILPHVGVDFIYCVHVNRGYARERLVLLHHSERVEQIQASGCVATLSVGGVWTTARDDARVKRLSHKRGESCAFCVCLVCSKEGCILHTIIRPCKGMFSISVNQVVYSISIGEISNYCHLILSICD